MHKKVTTCLMFVLLLVDIAVISTCIASNESFPTKDNQNTPKSASNSTLNYKDFQYDDINASTSDKISWSFLSTNESVNITVMAMDSANFSLFNTLQQFSCTTLSPGNLTNDSGYFSPNYSDLWHIVYLNNDTDMQQSTILSYNTTLIDIFSKISIVSPVSSSYWIRGAYYYIKWYTFGNITNIDINLFNNGTYYYTIDINVYNNGSYYWELPLNLPPSYNYQIMIEDTHNSTAQYFSAYFSIVTKVSFEITTPNSYSSWEEGYTYHIYWKTVGNIPRVNLFLYWKGNYYLTIITNLNNTESYFWTLPSYLPSSGPYKIKIEDASNLLTNGFSEDFYLNGGTSYNNTNINPISPSLWTIVVFTILLLVLLSFLGFRKRNTPNSKLSEKFYEIQKQQKATYEQQYISQKSNIGSDISILQNICPRCGVLVNDGMKFCPECGYQLLRD